MPGVVSTWSPQCLTHQRKPREFLSWVVVRWVFFRLVAGLCVVVMFDRYAHPEGLSTLALKLCMHEPNKQQGAQKTGASYHLSAKLLSHVQEATKPARKHRGLACHSIADSAIG